MFNKFRDLLVFVSLFQMTLSVTVEAQSKYLPVLNDPVEDAAVLISDATWSVDLSAHFGMEEVDNHVVRITSNQPIASGGFYSMDIALFSNAAPASRANFLNYVNDDDYPGTFIDLHSLTGNVLRTGYVAVQTIPTGLSYSFVAPDSLVAADSAISNTYGTVAMQKTTNGTNQIGTPFFFNLEDNSDNLDGAGNQTAVLGRVTRSTISTMALFGDPLQYPVDTVPDAHLPFPSVPVRGDYDGTAPQVEADLIVMDDVSLEPIPAGDYNTTTALTYSTVSTGLGAGDNPNLISSISVTAHNMDVVFAVGELGTSTVTVRATDSIGTTIDDTFTVTRSAVDYQAWRALYWTGADFSDNAISGPLADPDGDGVSNLQLYAQGFTANDHPECTHEALSGNGTNGEISFRLSKTADVTVALQHSDDLAQNDPWSSVSFTEQSRVDRGAYYQLTIQPAPTLQAKDFYRIAFQLNP